MKKTLLIVGIAWFLTGCTVARFSATYPDGTVLAGETHYLVQNKSLAWNPQTGQFDFSTKSDPMVEAMKTISSLAELAAKGAAK